MNLKSPVAVGARSRRRFSLAVVLVSALVAGLVTAAGPASPAMAQTAPATGVYVPLAPARIYNTQVAAQTSKDVQVTGLGGIPTTDVLAVVVDLTVYNNNSGAWGILWQAGTTRPYPASSINYVPGRVVTNSVTTKVGTSGSAAGKVSFYTWEATDMLIDVVGYYRTAPAGGGGYVPLTQTRILDTAGAKIPANSSIDRKLRGTAGIPDSTAVTAVVFNATVYGAAGPGPLTVWPRGVARPDTSVMNYSPATARTEMVTATLSADGWISVWTWASTDLIIDIAGYYTTGSNSTFVPLTPKRIVDTRYNGTRYNNNPNWGIGPITQYLTPNTATALKVTGTGGVPETGVSTVILNVVADAATTSTSSQIGFLTIWASGDAQPGILTMSYYGAESASNLVMAKVGADGKINVYNYYASTELIVDVVGYFTTGTGPGAPTNVMAAPANQAATLAWGPPASDGGTAIAGYLVKVYKTTPTLTYVSETTTCATCTSTTLTGLTNGQPYQFEVLARNSLGYGPSATSNVVTPNMTTTTSSSTTTSTSTSTTSTTVAPPRAPAAPRNVSASPGDRKVMVSWTSPVGSELNGSTLTGFTVTATPDCVCAAHRTDDPNATSLVVDGLMNGTSYSFHVRAESSAGPSPLSSPPITAVPTTPIPAFKVLTWNVERGYKNDNAAVFANRVSTSGATIVGFQEITAELAAAIANELQWPAPYYVESDRVCFIPLPVSQACVPYGNAILSQYPLSNTANWELAATNGEGQLKRLLLRASVSMGGEDVYFYTTHLATRSRGTVEERVGQTGEVRARVQLDQAQAQPLRAVVTGDFNSRPDERPITEEMNGLFTDSWRYANGPNGGLTGCFADNVPPGENGVPTCRIDYVFLWKDGGFIAQSATVGLNEGLSDHLSLSVGVK